MAIAKLSERRAFSNVDLPMLGLPRIVSRAHLCGAINDVGDDVVESSSSSLGSDADVLEDIRPS